MREESTWRQSGREEGSVSARKSSRKAKSFDLPFLSPLPPYAYLDVHVCTPSSSHTACMIEVIADAATSDLVPRHAPEARGLVRGGRDGGTEGEKGDGVSLYS